MTSKGFAHVEDDTHCSEAAIRIVSDAFKSVNWFRLQRINIQVSRNRRKAGRGKLHLGAEYIIITITTAPGGIHKNADRLIGNWGREELKRIWAALDVLRRK